MKKCMALLLTLALSAGVLAGCGSKEDNTTTAAPQTEAADQGTTAAADEAGTTAADEAATTGQPEMKPQALPGRAKARLR